MASTSGLGKLEAGSDTITSLVAARGKASITSGSPTAAINEMTFGVFFAGQPISGPGIPGGTTILEVSGSTLTLSNNASATNASATLSSSGPAPFAVGQQISGPGIPAEGGDHRSGGWLADALEGGDGKQSQRLAQRDDRLHRSAESLHAAAQLRSGEIHRRRPTSERRPSSPKGEDLYEYDVAKGIAHEAGARTLIATELALPGGMLGTSEDLSRAYLVSEEICSGEATNSEGDKAQAGKPNLYLYEAGESCAAGGLAFVAGLDDGDIKFEGDDGLSVIDPSRPSTASRVSGDGLHAAFMSRARLTGLRQHRRRGQGTGGGGLPL